MLARIEWKSERNRNIYTVESSISPAFNSCEYYQIFFEETKQGNKSPRLHTDKIIESVLPIKNDFFLSFSLAVK